MKRKLKDITVIVVVMISLLPMMNVSADGEFQLDGEVEGEYYHAHVHLVMEADVDVPVDSRMISMDFDDGDVGDPYRIEFRLSTRCFYDPPIDRKYVTSYDFVVYNNVGYHGLNWVYPTVEVVSYCHDYNNDGDWNDVVLVDGEYIPEYQQGTNRYNTPQVFPIVWENTAQTAFMNPNFFVRTRISYSEYRWQNGGWTLWDTGGDDPTFSTPAIPFDCSDNDSGDLSQSPTGGEDNLSGPSNSSG